MKQYNYIFGPVPSRRLGLSLGVDLIPYKTCSLDCIFCQLGRTTYKTMERCEYAPVDEVIHELEHWLEQEKHADCITLSGSGEPTLHIYFEKVLNFLKHHTKIPCVVLTNGTLLYRPEVREAIGVADIVKVSLSAWDKESFMKINRPCDGIDFELLVEGEIKFRESFKGVLWLEVFIMDKINDSEEQVKKIAYIAQKIKPDKIHLNTAVRPTAENYINRVDGERLKKLASLFEPTATIIADFSNKKQYSFTVNEKTIFNLLKRRPCTIEQIMHSLNIHINEILKIINILLTQGKVTTVIKNGVVYYSVKNI